MPGRQSASVRSALSGKGGRCCGIFGASYRRSQPFRLQRVPVPVPNTRYFASPRPMRVAIRAANASISTPLSEQFIGYANDFRGQFLAPTLHRRKTRLLHWFQCFRPAVHLLQWYRQRLPSQCRRWRYSEFAPHWQFHRNLSVLRRSYCGTGLVRCTPFHPASCPEHAAPLKRRSSALISPRPRRKTH